jgi:Holliday junction DNA helicase RuvA
MIRTLTGNIQEIKDNLIVIGVHDIGYLVRCLSTPQQFNLNQTVTLYTYLAVRETALDLYGFTDPIELKMFELLLGVPKVGPKSALQILNQSTPTLLVEATHKNDSVYLSKLSGIGKKTAENIIQYLHGKIEKLPEIGSTKAENLNQVQTDAIDTLISLGYDTTTARDIILKLSNDESTVNTLVTQALKQIQ